MNARTASLLSLVPAGLVLVLGSLSQPAQACAGTESSQRRLSNLLKSKTSGTSELAMPCDTMEVLFGETVTLPAGTRLHFGNTPSGKGMLWIKGTLRAEGTPENPLYLSGSWEPSLFGGKPGSRPWWGILVAGSGRVDFTYARIYGAKQGVQAQAGRVGLSKVYFQGTAALTLSDGKTHPLNPDGELVDSLRSEPEPTWAGKAPTQSGRNTGVDSTPADGASLSEAESGSAWPWVLGGLGLVALAGGASAYWFWPDAPDGGRPEPEPTEERQPVEGFSGLETER